MSLELLNGANFSFNSLALSLFVIFVASRVFKFAKDLKVVPQDSFRNVLLMTRLDGYQAVNYLPGLRVPFYPQHIFGALTPTVWWNPGIQFLWKWRFHCNLTYTFRSTKSDFAKCISSLRRTRSRSFLS